MLYLLLFMSGILVSSFFLLLVVAFGDTTVCPGASKAQTPHFNVSWCVSADEKEVIFIVSAAMYNYFGINYHENMTNVSLK